MSQYYLQLTPDNFPSPYDSNRQSTVFDEVNSGELLTIQAGYRDANKQIQDMILAGERLNSSRAFDEEELLDNDEYATRIAMIRHPNTDISEIETYTQAVNTRMANAKSMAERRAIEQTLDIGGTYKSYEEETEPTPVPPPASTNPPPSTTNSKGQTL